MSVVELRTGHQLVVDDTPESVAAALEDLAEDGHGFVTLGDGVFFRIDDVVAIVPDQVEQREPARVLRLVRGAD